MTPQDQEFLYIAEPRQYGDCQRAVIASLLDLSLEEVPHFLDAGPEHFYTRIEDFLEARGLEMLRRIDLARYLKLDENVYHQISGPSPRGQGIWHAVVGCNGQIVHDPHPSKAGLLDPEQWQYAILAPLTS